jgi:hypothetical protein
MGPQGSKRKAARTPRDIRERGSLKGQQDESIAVTPSSSSSSESPPKKVKVEGAELPQLISIRIYNETGVSSATKIDRSILMRISDFFGSLVENLDEGESEIALEEEDVYEAVELLITLVKLYRKKEEGDETAPVVQVLWNRSKAILSEKWLAQEYVDAYGDVLKKHIEDMMSKKPTDAAAVVEVSGITCWSSQDPAAATRVSSPVNGVYDKTGELAGGLPIYSRRGLSENGRQWIMEYYRRKKKWHIKSLENKGTTKCAAYVRCDPPMLPHLAKEVWRALDEDAPGAASKHIAQPAVEVSRVPAPPSADVLLFWEMLRTVFQYVGLMRGPIHSMKDLVKVLSKHHDLHVEEEMEQVMSKKDLLLLLSKTR